MLSGCLSFQKVSPTADGSKKGKSPEISINISEPKEEKKKEDTGKIQEPGVSQVTNANETSLNTERPREKSAERPSDVRTLNPKPPLLTPEEAIKQLEHVHYKNLYPVTVNEKPLLILKDITMDGQPEAFLLMVETNRREESEVSYLSDYSRLFSENREAMKFYLVVYGNQSGKLHRTLTVSLGKRYVYRSFEATQLNRYDSTRLIIAVGFQTEQGFEKHLLIFKGPQIKLLSSFDLKETLSIKSILTDIDDDGNLDILVMEKAMEEGVGYETFLTWFKWNGYRFSEYKSTNVVRNLRLFLKNVADLLKEGEYRKVIYSAIDRNILESVKKKGFSDVGALFIILGFDRYFDPNLSKPEDVLGNIKDIRFPEILENPFTKMAEGGWHFKISYRVTIQNGLSFIAESKIVMKKNPFGKKQFSFSPLR